MTKYIIAALAFAALASGAWAALEGRKIAALTAENARLERELISAREVARFRDRARQVAVSEALTARDRERHFKSALEHLLTGDFNNADTPIDPRIGDLLECLRAGFGNCGGDAGHSGESAHPLRDQ